MRPVCHINRIITGHEFFLGILIVGNHAQLEEAVYIDPGQIELVGKKARTRAARKKMMIVMPFARQHARSCLVDGKIRTVEIDAVHVLVFTLAMTGVIKSSYQNKPEKRSAETGQCESVSTDQPENSVPESPVQEPKSNNIGRLGNRTPGLILFK